MSVTRRQILKGFTLGTGSLLLAPVIDRLEARAAGATAFPRRFVFVVESNGLVPDQIVPQGLTRKKPSDRTRFEEVPLAGRQLPFALEPLAPFQDRLTIVQGLSGRVCGGGHSNNFGALGAFPTPKESQAIAGATIDGALAQVLPGVFPHVGLGISKRPENGIIYNVSAWGAGKALPTQCQPQLAYATLFGSAAGGAARQEFLAKNNLLDFLRDDVHRLESRLAGEEREQLQSYLQALEAMRNRQSRLNEIEHTLRAKGPVVSDKYRSPVETDRLDAQFDLGAAALICGLTNVLTLSSAAGIRDFDITFKGLGLNIDKHSIGHGKSYQGKTWYELSATIRRFHMDLIARLAAKLRAVKEGDGTLLDHTLIVYLSDAAEAHHSRCWEWPFVLLGNMGGKLKAGRYLEYPYYGQKGHHTIANLYTTFLHLARAPRESFGVPDPVLKDLDQKGPLSELLA